MENIRWLNDYTLNLSGMFAGLWFSKYGYIDADIGKIPPEIVKDAPGKDGCNSFVFDEVLGPRCKTEIHATIMLTHAIEDYVNDNMKRPRDTSKATLVWRIWPEVKMFPDEESNDMFFQGYARLMVLTKDSKMRSYY